MGVRLTTGSVLLVALGCSAAVAACNSPTDPTPTGLFDLSGLIVDAETRAPIPGAAVEVRVGADLSTPMTTTGVASPSGGYGLQRVPAVSYLRVTQYKYFDAIERVELTGSELRQRRSFALKPNPNIPDLNGLYTLTIEADESCPSMPKPLAPEFRRRTFTVQIVQVARKLTMTCLGNGVECLVGGQASNTGATFTLGTGPTLGFETLDDFLEFVAVNPTGFEPADHLVFLGIATTNYSVNGLVGKLDGDITQYQVKFGAGRQGIRAFCLAGNFELTRR
jgi:hypothetical protein